MKILLTGANGMVGKNILEHSKAQQYEILAPKRSELDLLDRSNVRTYLSEHKPDFIIHGAGRVGGIHANVKNPVFFFSDNATGGINLITNAFECGIKKFLNISSVNIYPSNSINPLKEESLLLGPLESATEGYSLAKLICTKLCEYVNKENVELTYKSIIPCNLYGKYDKFDPKHSHMIPAVIQRLFEAKNDGLSEVDIWGDGLARREFMYAGDLADFIFYAIENFEKMPQNINVGLGHDYSINEYYKIIAGIVGFEGKLIHDLSRPVGMKQKLIDDTNLRAFGWQHKTSLEDGLQKTFEYLKEIQ